MLGMIYMIYLFFGSKNPPSGKNHDVAVVDLIPCVSRSKTIIGTNTFLEWNQMNAVGRDYRLLGRGKEGIMRSMVMVDLRFGHEVDSTVVVLLNITVVAVCFLF